MTTRKTLGSAPTPDEIKAARAYYELTSKAAAALIYMTTNAWQRWEAGDRAMHPAIWEYWNIRAEEQRRAAKKRR